MKLLKATVFLSAALTALGFNAVAQEPMEWYMIPDNGSKIPMKEVGYLVAADDNRTFSIVTAGGHAIGDVTSVTFEKGASSGVDGIAGTGGFSMIADRVSSTLTISGAAGHKAEIYSLAGRKMLEVSLSGNSEKINVAPFESGVYLLKVGDTSIKFIKN